MTYFITPKRDPGTQLGPHSTSNHIFSAGEKKVMMPAGAVRCWIHRFRMMKIIEDLLTLKSDCNAEIIDIFEIFSAAEKGLMAGLYLGCLSEAYAVFGVLGH